MKSVIFDEHRVTGIMLLLTNIFGPVISDVLMVAVGSVAGAMLALSEKDEGSDYATSVVFVVRCMLVAFVLAWGVASIIVKQLPEYDNPYIPSIIAFLISWKPSFLLNMLKRGGSK